MLFGNRGKKKRNWQLTVHINEIFFVDILNSIHFIAMGAVLIHSHEN